jgi:hypothetical protein
VFNNILNRGMFKCVGVQCRVFQHGAASMREAR